ncbi:isoamylase early set domain-containing protein [Cryptosporangium aurantiacum]|uniref:Glycogen recognition site of AMP-activated protein kinase n=1 Tax=Cryptosporangium aurantiacum TaxID=134849 RepID=A0A1M7RH08_9ACTN|nr:isoamylase early set domain-containing protein [Cryptosporangium aurantiacum]SHN45573.1 Glycogen recognition site of AMP-activated protein kinase [Cryptosporangium aurantiacum]
MLKRTRLNDAKTKVTFTLPMDDTTPSVSVVGDFNGWQPGKHELTPRRNGMRSVTLTLPTGVHRFRYLGTGGVWLDDAEADRIDAQGSVLEV